jgi:hypothetical protein
MKAFIRLTSQLTFATTLALVGVIPAYCQGGVPGYPDRVQGYDPREVALLPQYCIYTQLFREVVPGGANSAEIKRWTAIMGPSFHNMHHYCWGLMKTNRALFLVRNQQMRSFYLRDALEEFNYVIRRASSDFKLLPEILTKKGENLIRLDRGKEAIPELRHAIALNPGYWPPYAALSDYYVKTGDSSSARHWLEQGLSHNPDVKALKKRLAEIDAAGDKPTEAPKAEPAADKSSVETSAAGNRHSPQPRSSAAQ